MIREGKLHCQPDPKADPFLRQAQNIFDGGSKWGASHLTSIAELDRHLEKGNVLNLEGVFPASFVHIRCIGAHHHRPL